MDWIEEAVEKAGSQAALARSLGVTPQVVSFWAAGMRSPGPANAADLNRLYSIRQWRTRPDDWHRIWPDLVGAPGAPAAPVAGEAA